VGISAKMGVGKIFLLDLPEKAGEILKKVL